MSAFLERLAARLVDGGGAVRPRLPSRFETPLPAPASTNPDGAEHAAEATPAAVVARQEAPAVGRHTAPSFAAPPTDARGAPVPDSPRPPLPADSGERFDARIDIPTAVSRLPAAFAGSAAPFDEAAGRVRPAPDVAERERATVVSESLSESPRRTVPPRDEARRFPAPAAVTLAGSHAVTAGPIASSHTAERDVRTVQPPDVDRPFQVPSSLPAAAAETPEPAFPVRDDRAAAPTIVHVTIGTVELRDSGVPPKAPRAVSRALPAARLPQLSLKDYLRRRGGERQG